MIDNKSDPQSIILAAAKRCYLADGIAATGMKLSLIHISEPTRLC